MYMVCVFCLFTLKTWNTIVKETECLARLMNESSDRLHTCTLDKLNQLISEKKATRKLYAEERLKLECDFNKVYSKCN